MSNQLIDVTKTQDGGVMKEIITEGLTDRKPSKGNVVYVHYVGTLTDGSQFDSSRDRGEKFKFTLGKGEVIKAWDLGVASMNQGEKCKLTCASNYAYGKNGSPPKIPPNSTLVFEIELFDFKGEDLTTNTDGGIMRTILQEGTGYDHPNEESLVEMKIVGKCDGKEFDNRQVSYNLGDGIENNIPEGVEKALEKFKMNEKSIITLSPKYGFGSEGNEGLGIGSNSTLEYEIHLENFEKVKEVWEMDQVQKLDKAKLCKTRGTEYFTKENYQLAIKQYRKVPDLLSYDSGLSDDQKAESANILKAASLNLSLCHFKLKDYANARDFATKAIEIDDSNVKGYFRRAKALMALRDPSQAKEDFEKSLQLDPKNKAIANEYRQCKLQLDEAKKKDRQIYKGMFDTFAKRDNVKNARNGVKNDVMAGDLGEWETKQKKGLGSEEEELPAKDDINDLSNIEML